MVGGSIALLFLLICTTPVIGGEGVVVGPLAIGQIVVYQLPQACQHQYYGIILSLFPGYLGTTGWLLCGARESVQ